MNPEEYAKLAEVEASHWFYAGKREIVRWWLQRVMPPQPGHLLVDCGAGTGRFAQEMRAFCRVIAVDDHQESLDIARTRLGDAGVQRGNCCALPMPDASVDILTALDVIEHVEDDAAGLREFARVLKPGGVAVITVPALQALWSDWDVALHHFRRYTRRRLLQAIPADRFEIAHCAYINVAALPAVYIVRKTRAILQTGKSGSNQRSEDQVPSPAVNRLLRFLFVKLACQTAVKFPAGVGLLAVITRKTK